MICYDCGAVVTTAWRQFRLPKRGNGQGKHQDICHACYMADYEAKGYVAREKDGIRIWEKVA